MGGHPIAENTLHVHLEILNRVVTGDPEQLSHHAVTHQDDIKLSKSKQWTVTFLILLCNLFQYTSMFSTVAGGYEFAKKVGHNTGPGDANWMGAAYSLTQSAFVLISGRLGAIYGHQRLVLLGCTTIVVFSIVNAFCNTYTSFIIARALTGIGGGIHMPNALVKRIFTDTCIIYYEQERTVSISEPQVSQTSILSAQPDSASWGLRRQDECHHMTHPAKRETDFGIAYAATDITKDSGAIRVVVGSNNWTDERDPTEKEETLIELRKGDAILCLGSVFYGQAKNTTDSPSVLLTAFSTPGYRRQEENQYLAVPWEVASQYSSEVQRFLGYYVSRPYGGAVEHMEPLDYLKVKGDWSKYILVDLI